MKTNTGYSGIYCHFDGYKSGVGAMLKSNYNTPQKIKQLIALGAILSLGKEIGKKQDFQNPTNKDWTKAYHRDGNEKLRKLRAKKLSEVYIIARNNWSDYIYIFENARWNLLVDGNILAVY